MKNSNLFIEQIERGPLDNLLYILVDESTKKIALVDPAWDVTYLLKQIQFYGGDLDKIILTHGHHDHVNGITQILAHYPNTPIYISAHEANHLIPPFENNHIKTSHHDVISLGNHKLTVIHTPGHTPGCQCFVYDNQWIITGDTLFINGCGRCDLKSGNAEQLFHSLQHLLTLDDQLIIYPGHRITKKTTDSLGHQKQTNPYLKLDKNHFIARRMGL